MYEPIVTYLGGLITAVVIWFLSDISNSKQRAHDSKLARDARLADYEAFLLDWEQRIERSKPEEIANDYFTEGAAQFRSRAAKVRRDFTNIAEFNRRDTELCRLTPQQVRGDATRNARDVLADAIRHVITYVQSA